MSTTPVESWAVDLTTLGPIYPFVGFEGLMIFLGVAFWIFWHIWQLRDEKRTYDEDMKILSDPAKLERAMKEGRLDE